MCVLLPNFEHQVAEGYGSVVETPALNWRKDSGKLPLGKGARIASRTTLLEGDRAFAAVLVIVAEIDGVFTAECCAALAA